MNNLDELNAIATTEDIRGILAEVTEILCNNGPSKYPPKNYLNGDRYEGNWRLGLRHGKGKAMFPSRGTEQGEVGYEGEWVDDKAEG